jgi:hypothetical protein
MRVRSPWALWFRKKRFHLIQGKHYQCMPHCMGVLTRNAAARHGLHVSVFIKGTTLTVETTRRTRHA